MLASPRTGWQLDSMVRPVHGLITTFITTLGRWLQVGLSKHRLELVNKMLAKPRRGWQQESMVRLVEELITKFMATLSRWLEGELSKHRLELTPSCWPTLEEVCS